MFPFDDVIMNTRTPWWGRSIIGHCYHICPWVCAWDAWYIIFSHLIQIHSEKTRILFSLLLYSSWWVQIVRYIFGLQNVFVCLYITPSHYHYCANLSEDTELIKCLSDTFVECVSKIKNILSVIHYTICGAVCFQFTHFPCDDWENIYIYIYFVLVSPSKYEL